MAGFTLYKAVSSAGGNVTVSVPNFDGVTEYPYNSRNYVSISELLNYIPDYVIEATMIVGLTSYKERLLAWGFPFVISIEELDGVTWTFEDGSTIVFSLSGTSANATLTRADGQHVVIGVNTSVDYSVISFPSDRLFNGRLGNGYYEESIAFSGTRANVYRYPNTATTPVAFNFWENIEPAVESSDPFSPGGESETGGGEGNFDGTSVDVDFTPLPTLSAVDTGFITLYNPTLSQLQSLAHYMWSDLFDLDTLKKLFADPMQAILGLSILPGPIPSGASQAVKVGNIATNVNMTKAASQYFDVDCGTLNVKEFWGAYLDYEPYTKAEIYLPYIGTHQIAVDDIMGKAVHIKYHVDVLSGACSAEIKCGGSVLYTFIGSVAVSVPVTGNDWTNVINGVLSIAGSIGSMVATGGLSAPSAIGSIASAAVNQLKPSIQKSGSVSGGGGILAGKVPVLILTRPRQALPASQNEFTGYPAFITRSLGEISGYTEVHKIRLGGIPATDAELEEIEGLLKGGVIL